MLGEKHVMGPGRLENSVAVFGDQLGAAEIGYAKRAGFSLVGEFTERR
jgi:hypothetical protein